MSFDNATNVGRVNKIMDLLDLIEKSANSNNVSPQDVFKFLDRPIAKIGHMSGMDTDLPETEPVKEVTAQKVTQSHRAPRWADIREMAQRAPLKDLSVAMAVFLNRFDEHMDTRT